MRQLIYVSKSTDRSAAASAPDILRGARAHNGVNGVTGLLCATEDRFLQLLEGPEDSVASAMVRINRDLHHRDIEIKVDRAIEARAFSDWSMAYREKGLPAEALAERLSVSLAGTPAEVSDLFHEFAR